MVLAGILLWSFERNYISVSLSSVLSLLRVGMETRRRADEVRALLGAYIFVHDVFVHVCLTFQGCVGVSAQHLHCSIGRRL